MDKYLNEEIIWRGKPSFRGSLSFIGIIGHMFTCGISLVIKWFFLKFTEYTITNENIHERRGILAKTDDEIRLYRVRDLSSHQSFLQRLLRHQNITVISTDQTKRIFKLRAVPTSLLPTLRNEISKAREKENIQIIE